MIYSRSVLPSLSEIQSFHGGLRYYSQDGDYFQLGIRYSHKESIPSTNAATNIKNIALREAATILKKLLLSFGSPRLSC